MILPFGILLATIALGPLLFPKWWHHHYPKVALSLGSLTLVYYLFGLKATTPVLHVAHEYVSFIALIGSLFIVSGGIHIKVKGESTPFINVAFLLFGAIIANIIGTTGASMLLIRPWIRMNRYRITTFHIVFFIFIVSNLGGCLTPIGDPPLFLGYLKGVPFWWVLEHCWPMWLTGVGMMLAIFFAVDYRNYLKAPKAIRQSLAEPADEWRFEGKRNLGFLAVIMGSVFIQHPMFLREGIMVAAALGSLYFTPKRIHESNDFNFEPIREVAILFIGIFATMLPALNWLQANAKEMTAAIGESNITPGLFFWACGILSAMLDNAPTYVSFLTTIFGVFIPPDHVAAVQEMIKNGGHAVALAGGGDSSVITNTYAALKQYHPALLASGNVSVEQVDMAYLIGNLNLNLYLVAISIGSVFFGAATYIGNGPNFMVKAIADQNKVHTPTFLGYIFKFSLPFLLPVLLVVWLIFFL